MKFHSNIPSEKASQLNIAQCCQESQTISDETNKLAEYNEKVALEHNSRHTSLHKEMRKARFIRALKPKCLNQLK